MSHKHDHALPPGTITKRPATDENLSKMSGLELAGALLGHSTPRTSCPIPATPKPFPRLRTLGVARVIIAAACFTAISSIPSHAAEHQEYEKKVAVKPLLQTSTTVTGQPIRYPKSHPPEVKMVMVEIPQGAETGWHLHPMPCFAYVLSGEIRVEVRDAKKGTSVHTYHAGEAIAETVNTPHNGKNIGHVPVRILMTVVGEKGAPIASKLKQ
jgi:quercetin dioxygenase-like cupin family protein